MSSSPGPTLHKLLKGDRLPPAKLMAAVLAGCGTSPQQINVWLYHRARIEIAGVRHTPRHTPTGRASGRGMILKEFTYRSRRSLQILMAAATLIVALLQVLSHR